MKKFLKKIGAGLSSTILDGAGFTMIELLIVIAVLGVLATAVLSAINPIEQINRGRDTGSRSDSEQLLSAFDRYYTTQELYPWQDTADDAADLDLRIVNSAWEETGGNEGVLEKLSAGGTAEIKESFVNRLDKLDDRYKLHVHYTDSPGNSAYVCFEARSGSFKTEALTRCETNCAGLPSDLDVSACDLICDADFPKICLP